MGYGNMIREARKAKKLTQEELASQLGVTRQTVFYWEHEDAKPADEIKIPICKELDIDPAAFLLAIVSSNS